MAILLDENVRVVVQGGASDYALGQMQGMRAAGTTVVGMVSPGRGSQQIGGVVVFNTMLDAVEATGATASCVYVPAPAVRDALVENADAGIRLSMVATEMTPLQDVVWGLAYGVERGLWVVGPNCVGMISPGRALLGSLATGYTKLGRIGVMGRSGTLTLTTCRIMTRAGYGQSTCIHMGGDAIVGRNPLDYLQAFLDDDETDVIVMLTEVGGTKEYAMLECIASATKPIVILVVGRHVPPGRRMGHAGAIVTGIRGTAEAKRAALRGAGAHIADSPYHIVQILSELVPQLRSNTN